MPSGPVWLAFIAASLVVLITPGPGVIYVVSRSLHQGRRAGLVSVLGLSAGALLHVVAATVGLSALLVASASAFTAVKLLGAGYLIWLGVRTVLDDTPLHNDAEPVAIEKVFRDGIIVSALNPKIAVFFLAFLPQFADPARGPVTMQILALGMSYVALALVTDGAYAILASSARGWLRGPFVRSRAPRVATGLVYIGLGVATAVSGRRS